MRAELGHDVAVVHRAHRRLTATRDNDWTGKPSRTGACWRRTVTEVDQGQRGGYAVRGEHLPAGAAALLAVGTLVIAVDRRTTGLALPRGAEHGPVHRRTPR
ncbi:hypothetical protein [Streptomyces murinus]|uniref:hypothetical protein n=1 Tax=Streptomyces murinus TaxID=33900 RepID=UPI00381D45D0